ncbi:MAG TPA: ribosome maturation factor RimM [Nevskiaceae bacterium]|nr:ribosome maturation factor RimM [Nevskiaceae bacterium]
MSDGARIALGRIAGVFGVRGWLRVESWTRPVENLLQYHHWWLGSESWPEVQLVEGRIHGRGLVAQLADPAGVVLDDCDRAASLVGASVEVERRELPPAPLGSWYWADLVGLEVRGLAGEVLGRVDSLTSNGAQDVMVVACGARRLLIPFVADAVVHEVDLAAGAIVVDWAADY